VLVCPVKRSMVPRSCKVVPVELRQIGASESHKAKLQTLSLRHYIKQHHHM